MAAVLVLSAAYAAYMVYRKTNADTTESEVDLEGKSSVALLPHEDEVSMFELPIGTITFFEGGDIQKGGDVARYVRQRVADILENNPWLGGWLVLDKGKLKIFHENSMDLAEGAPVVASDALSRHFVVFEPGQLKIGRDTPYNELAPMLAEADAVAHNNMDIIGKDKPVFKVALIPTTNNRNDNNDGDEEGFCLVVSMSHAVGDPYTYYRILSMMDKDAEVEALDPARRADYPEALFEKVGKEERDFLLNALRNPCSKVSPDKLLQDPVTCKLFYLNEEWIVKSNGERGSLFAANVAAPNPQQGEQQKFAANCVLSSWFMKHNRATVGFMPCNMRNRLPGCPLGPNSAGNYTHGVLYMPDDYRSAALIQLSIADDDDNDNNTDDKEATGTFVPAEAASAGCLPGREKKGGKRLWRILERAPKLDRDAKTSIVAPWASLYRDEIRLSEDSRQRLHLMLMHADLFKQVVPNTISLLLTFTATPASSSAPGGVGTEATARAGVFLICKQSLWKEIKDCGIVDEMIFDG